MIWHDIAWYCMIKHAWSCLLWLMFKIQHVSPRCWVDRLCQRVGTVAVLTNGGLHSNDISLLKWHSKYTSNCDLTCYFQSPPWQDMETESCLLQSNGPGRVRWPTDPCSKDWQHIARQLLEYTEDGWTHNWTNVPWFVPSISVKTIRLEENYEDYMQYMDVTLIDGQQIHHGRDMYYCVQEIGLPSRSKKRSSGAVDVFIEMAKCIS